jgi:hypothetical protein
MWCRILWQEAFLVNLSLLIARFRAPTQQEHGGRRRSENAAASVEIGFDRGRGGKELVVAAVLP